MRSFKETALRAIKRNPEIFSALEEFERTGKLPKYSYRKRIDITIDNKLLQKFKTRCQIQGISMSRAIEKHIKEALKNK